MAIAGSYGPRLGLGSGGPLATIPRCRPSRPSPGPHPRMASRAPRPARRAATPESSSGSWPPTGSRRRHPRGARRSASSAARGSWSRGPMSFSAWRLRAGHGARRAGRDHPRPRGRAARLLQRVPASGRAGGAARGNRKSLQCRYHGWTYGLDGALRACPEMEETEDFAQGRLRPGAGPRRALGPVRVRQPGRRRRRWPR